MTTCTTATARPRQGSNTVAPVETARAQVGWDCWAERQSTDYSFLPADERCAGNTSDYIAKAAGPGALPAPAAAAKPEPGRTTLYSST